MGAPLGCTVLPFPRGKSAVRLAAPTLLGRPAPDWKVVLSSIDIVFRPSRAMNDALAGPGGPCHAGPRGTVDQYPQRLLEAALTPLMALRRRLYVGLRFRPPPAASVGPPRFSVARCSSLLRLLRRGELCRTDWPSSIFCSTFPYLVGMYLLLGTQSRLHTVGHVFQSPTATIEKEKEGMVS